MTLITVGISVYNAERFLKFAIDSVLEQSYENFEFIIIDDGSIDDSVNIIKSYTDSRIHFICDGKNKGLPARLNQIAQLAKGKFIARMDADDIMHKDRLATQVAILENNSEIDVLGSNAYVIDANNNTLGVRFLPINGSLINTKSFIHPTIIGKASWFKKNLYDEKAIRIEDFELWFRTNDFSNFKRIDTPLLYYRELDQLVFKKYLKGLPSFFYLLNKYLKQRKFKKAIIIGYVGFLFFLKFLLFYLLFLFNKEEILLKNRYKVV